jgi:hypothetical protein
MITTLSLKRRDKNYRLLEERIQPARSWVAGFTKLLYVCHAQLPDGGGYSMNDVTNTARTIEQQGDTRLDEIKATLKMLATGGGGENFCGAGSIKGTAGTMIQDLCIDGEWIGIQCGTGVGAVAPTDVALGTRIAHGQAAGTLQYGGMELVDESYVNPNASWMLRRFFTNQSGGGITVQEVGIYSIGCEYVVADFGHAYVFCVARDLTGGIAVADTELLEVTYTVSVTV